MTFDDIVSTNPLELRYVNSGDLLRDAKTIIETSREAAYTSVNYALVIRNWLLGKRILEDDLEGNRAEYGTETIKSLAKELKKEYGTGFDPSNLYRFVKFYEYYPNIFDTPCRKFRILSWSHYRILIQVHDQEVREWYEKEALAEVWSVKTLQRNVSTQYYYRLLKSQNNRPVKKEMQTLTAKYQQDKLEFIKNPVIAEFLGLSRDTSYLESDLEQFIINNLQKFIMELGKGYAFVCRQQHIQTEKENYFIDLVFYNYILK